MRVCLWWSVIISLYFICTHWAHLFVCEGKLLCMHVCVTVHIRALGHWLRLKGDGQLQPVRACVKKERTKFCLRIRRKRDVKGTHSDSACNGAAGPTPLRACEPFLGFILGNGIYHSCCKIEQCGALFSEK